MDRRQAQTASSSTPGKQIVSTNCYSALLDRCLDRKNRNPFVRRIAACFAIKPRQPAPAAFVVQSDHLPVFVEDGTSAAPGLGRRPIVNARHARNLRCSARRPLVIEKLVVLKREGKFTSTRMPNDVNIRVPLDGRQGHREGKGATPTTALWTRSTLALCCSIGDCQRIASTQQACTGSTASNTTSVASGLSAPNAPSSLTTEKFVTITSSSGGARPRSPALTRNPLPNKCPSL
jgi:hypothetical protein